MRLRMTLLAALVAMVASVAPARADLVFEFRSATTMTQQTPGPIINSLSLLEGGPNAILQITLRDTGGVGAPSPTNPRILPYGPGVTGTGDQLTGWGFRLIAPTSAGNLIARHNPPVNLTANTRAGMTPAGFGNVIVNGSDTTAFTQSTLRNITLGDGVFEDGSGDNGLSGQTPGVYVLCNILINPVAAGMGQFSIVDPGTSDDVGTPNNPSFDVAVFDQPFVLPVTVVPVPEPSSMALVGLAIAGLGYRARRKAAKV